MSERLQVTPEELQAVVERQAKHMAALQTRQFVVEAKLAAAEAELAKARDELALLRGAAEKEEEAVMKRGRRPS